MKMRVHAHEHVYYTYEFDLDEEEIERIKKEAESEDPPRAPGDTHAALGIAYETCPQLDPSGVEYDDWEIEEIVIEERA